MNIKNKQEIFLIWPGELEKHSALYPPLGLSYLSSVLKKNRYKPIVVDLLFDKKLNSIRNMNGNASVYCISVATPNYKRVKKLIKIIRANDEKAIVLIGGPHATVFPKESLESLDADIVLIGESEESFLEVLRSIKSRKGLEQIDGIAYRSGKKILINQKTKFIENLDEIPYPDQGAFPIEKYFKMKGFRELSIITTRGCPGNCVFCQPTLRKIFGKRIRFQSPKRMVDEIEFLVKKFKLDLFVISDDSFGFSKQRVKDICKEIIKRKINVFWRCQSRVGLDEETLMFMKKAGCILIAFGVESGSQLILNNLRKGITVELVKKTFKLCKKVGILAHAYIMIGSIGETEETMNETMDLIKEIKPFTLFISITTPYPGTDLYSYALTNNLLSSKEWSNYDHILSSTAMLKIPGMTSRKIKRYKGILEKTNMLHSEKIRDLSGLVLDTAFIKKILMKLTDH